MSGGSAAAFDDARAGEQRLLVQRPFACPAAGEVVQRVMAGGQRPGRSGGLLNGDGAAPRFSMVADRARIPLSGSIA